MTATTNFWDPIPIGRIPLEHRLDYPALPTTIPAGARVA